MLSRITVAFLILSAGAATAAAQGAESVYTDLAASRCRTVESEHEGYSWTRVCPGVAGYRLRHMYGDERESITVVRPDGSQHPLELWSTVSQAFSSVGAKAEWRVRRLGRRVEPFALILRYNANDNPDHYEKIFSYLVVARLGPGKVCVVDKIAPGPRANELARASADASAAKPCLRAIGDEAPADTQGGRQ